MRSQLMPGQLQMQQLQMDNERLKQELLGQQISDQRIESKFRKQQIKDAMDWFAARPQLRAFGTSPGEAISVAMGLEQFEAQQKEAEDQRKFRDEILGKLSGGEDQEADDAMQFGSEIADWVNEQAAGTIGIGLRPEMLQSIKNRAVGALAKGQSREAVFEFVASQTQQWLAQAQLQKQAALTSATEPEIQGPPLPEGMGPMGGARSLVLPDVIGPSFTEFIRGANARAAPPSPPAFSTATAGRRL